MTKHEPKGTTAWVSLVSDSELPALTSMVHKLEQISHNEASSLALLGQSILHDHALTSKILRIANSSKVGRNRVTTISRAVIILGLENIKSICITAKLLTGLLKAKHLSSAVYERLLTLMALSFQSAMIAKMMAAHYDEQTQEEIFIAALLHHIGETAFWSLGGPITEQLDKALKQHPKQAERVVQEKLGTNFNAISKGIAMRWNYGDFLVKSFDNPTVRTKEMQLIELADQLSFALYAPEKSPQPVSQLVAKCAELIEIQPTQFRDKLSQTVEQTLKQLTDYGAPQLAKYIKTDLSAGIYYQQPEDIEPELNRQAIQLEVLKELAQMATEQANVNQILNTALEGIARGVGFERTVILLKDQHDKSYSPRFICAQQAEELKRKLIISPLFSELIYHQLVEQKQPIKLEKSEQAFKALPLNISSLVCEQGFCLAPIVVHNRCVGIVYGDFAISNLPVSSEEFECFCHIVLQTNLVLSVVK